MWLVLRGDIKFCFLGIKDNLVFLLVVFAELGNLMVDWLREEGDSAELLKVNFEMDTVGFRSSTFMVFVGSGIGLVKFSTLIILDSSRSYYLLGVSALVTKLEILK